VGRHAAVPAPNPSTPPPRRHHHRATRQSLSVAELRFALAPRQLEIAPVGVLRVGDLIAQLRPTSSAVRLETDYVGVRRARQASAWRTAVPALVRPATAPMRVVLRRPVLSAAVVVAAVAATAATSLPANSTATHTTHRTRVAGVATAAPEGLWNAASNSDVLNENDQRQRVSRDKRTPLKKAHKSLLKPGQTVPGRWVLPAPGVITTCFCMRWGVMHEGIDIAKGYGVAIRAVGDGVVIKVGPAPGFGNWVVIQHSNGDVSIYGHMESYSVDVGEHIKAGQIIAHEGSMGYSTGPHLHFEVHRGGFDGPPIDPVPWLRARGVSIPMYDPNG
jgi:murein DD-endopeptidase MepM/ murein hydrolase activator NlpD